MKTGKCDSDLKPLPYPQGTFKNEVLHVENEGDLIPVPDGDYTLENGVILKVRNSEIKRKRNKLIYNIILHILAIIGAILFLTSCNDSERDKQRAEQKKITQAIERKIDSLQRIQESDKIWRNQ